MSHSRGINRTQPGVRIQRRGTHVIWMITSPYGSEILARGRAPNRAAAQRAITAKLQTINP